MAGDSPLLDFYYILRNYYMSNIETPLSYALTTTHNTALTAMAIAFLQNLPIGEIRQCGGC